MFACLWRKKNCSVVCRGPCPTNVLTRATWVHSNNQKKLILNHVVDFGINLVNGLLYIMSEMPLLFEKKTSEQSQHFATKWHRKLTSITQRWTSTSRASAHTLSVAMQIMEPFWRTSMSSSCRSSKTLQNLLQSHGKKTPYYICSVCALWQQ